MNSLAVHGASGHTNIARCNRRTFRCQVDIFIFRTAKNRNGIFVFSGSNNTHHVADVDRVLSMSRADAYRQLQALLPVKLRQQLHGRIGVREPNLH